MNIIVQKLNNIFKNTPKYYWCKVEIDVENCQIDITYHCYASINYLTILFNIDNSITITTLETTENVYNKMYDTIIINKTLSLNNNTDCIIGDIMLCINEYKLYFEGYKNFVTPIE